MLPILLALANAASYGAGDFFTGLASRQAPIKLVMLISPLAATIFTVIVAVMIGGTPSSNDYIYGSLVGLALLGGPALLAYAFREGRVSEVAPALGVVSIAVPVLFALCLGDRFHFPVYLGIACAIIAIALVSQRSKKVVLTVPRGKPLLAAIGSGALFGAFSIILSVASDETNFWILVIANAVRLVAMIAWCLPSMLRSELVFKPYAKGIIHTLIAALFVNSGTVFYLAALQHAGNIAVVNTIAAQATIVSVSLACLIFKERIYPVQAIGILTSVASITLIAFYA